MVKCFLYLCIYPIYVFGCNIIKDVNWSLINWDGFLLLFCFTFSAFFFFFFAANRSLSFLFFFFNFLYKMADPFDDIDGIVKAKETEVSIAQSALFNKDKDAPQAPQAEEGEAYLQQFPKRVQAKAAGDLEYRLEMEQVEPFF